LKDLGFHPFYSFVHLILTKCLVYVRQITGVNQTNKKHPCQSIRSELSSALCVVWCCRTGKAGQTHCSRIASLLRPGLVVALLSFQAQFCLIHSRHLPHMSRLLCLSTAQNRDWAERWTSLSNSRKICLAPLHFSLDRISYHIRIYVSES
jgi:hypothetical protein